MTNLQFQAETVHERTVMAIRHLLDRGLTHLEGMERTAATRLVPMLYPRVERKVLEASEEDLRQELRYLKSALEAVLQESPKARTPRRTERKKRKSPKR